MKKIITILLILSCFNSKAQNNIGLGIGSAVAAGGLITTFFYMSNKELKSYTYVADNKKAIQSSRQTNAPYLFVGIGCAILSAASFTNNVSIGKGLSLRFKGTEASLTYAIK